MLVDLNKFPISRTRHPVWAKISAIMEVFAMYPSTEWVWWLDVDAIIMTTHLDLYEHLLNPDAMRARLVAGDLLIPNDRVPGTSHHSLLTGEVDPEVLSTDFKTMNPSEIDIICVQDKGGFNAGSFFIRNNALMQLFVDLWSDPILVEYADIHWFQKEQDLFLYLIFEHPTLRKRVGWVKQNLINAYHESRGGEQWESGDLVVHFPNCA